MSQSTNRRSRVCVLRVDPFLLAMVLVFLAVIDSSNAIKCYKCAVFPEKSYIGNDTIITPMCSKFDESDQYIVDCPYSTMCLKTISTLQMQNGQKQETVTRGCAQQKHTTQVFRNSQWQQEHSVQEVYEEGCVEFKENNLAGSANTHCYCRGKLCNSGVLHTLADFLYARGLAVIVCFNLLHWIRL